MISTVTAATSAPVWDITSTGRLTIQGPDSVGGTIGWYVHNASGGPHTLKSIRANDASDYGVLIASNGNDVSWNDVSGNGTGVRVTGSSNKLKGGDVNSNKGNGVELAGNSNELSGATIEGNTGNGIVATGNTNLIKSNKTNLNGGDGIKSVGTGNKYSGNGSNTGGKENTGFEYSFVAAGTNQGSNRADGVNVPTAGKCPNFAAAGSFCE